MEMMKFDKKGRVRAYRNSATTAKLEAEVASAGPADASRREIAEAIDGIFHLSICNYLKIESLHISFFL